MTFYITGCDKAQSYSDFRPISFPKDNCDCAAIQRKLDQQEHRFTQILNLLNKLEQRVTELPEQVLNTTSTDPAQLGERILEVFDQQQNKTASVLANHTAKLDQLDNRFSQLLEQLQNQTNKIDHGQPTQDQSSCSILPNDTDNSLSSQDKENAKPSCVKPTDDGNSSALPEPFWPIVSGAKVPYVDTQFGSKWILVLRNTEKAGFWTYWKEYRNGWGNPNVSSSGFWLGLENLHRLTKNAPHELVVEMTDMKGQARYARYSRFRIGSEAQRYAILELGSHSGSAGDGLSAHLNYGFSTTENGPGSACSTKHGHGGWWYFGSEPCYESCLTGNANRTTDFGVIWGKFKKEEKRTHLRSATMMIRAV